jgi:hypothetical protein
VRGALAAIAILLFAPAALAQPSEDDKALALTLFKRGRELMEAKRLDEACASFAESQRLDPGGGTLLNLALCHEEQGRTATAWAELSDALAVARRDQRTDRIELAQSHMTALEPKLSRLVINVPSGIELRVTRNASDVPVAARGIAIPVDPGLHVVEAFAGAASVFRIEIEVGRDADRRVVDVVPVLPLVAATPAPAVVVERPSERRSSFRPILGWILVGAGTVSMGAGTYFGIRAIDEESASDAGCTNGRCTNASVESSDRAKGFADASTATIGLGALAVAAGIALLLFDR